MFCPACGRENDTDKRKFCVSCGINLEVISQALTRDTDDFFTRLDTGFDQFIARYSERVFKNDASNALDRRVSKSWKILGKGIVTSFIDIFLFFLVWNILPLRFLILLISTPIRLVTERGKYQKDAAPELGRKKVDGLPPPSSQEWLPEPVASVTEHTTAILSEPPKKESNLNSVPRNKSRA